MITIESAFEEFLLDTRSRLSRNTTQWYRASLHDIVERLKGTPIDQVPSLVIRQYLTDLRDAASHRRGAIVVQGPITHESQRGRHRALKTFFNWCVIEYDLDSKVNPMRKIKALPPSGHEPKAVNMADVRKVLAAIDDSSVGKRDRAVLYFMLDTGCRAGGIVSLTMDRLDMEHRRAIVIEKGDRARVVPFSDLTLSMINDWLSVRPVDAQTLFCNCSTNPATNGSPITPIGLREVLRRLKAKAGIEGRFNPHSFRHGFAREFLTNGGSMPALQQMLGHSTSHVTMQFYARWDVNELAEQHQKHSPLQGLKG